MNTEAKAPLIMITNDDGISAEGIKLLAHIAKRFGDVIVVAPDSANSGKSHSITVCQPLKVSETTHIQGVKCYAVSGTPVDCVKIGVHTLLSRKPDIILSGINHGGNYSSSVHYSGTLGATREAAMLGILGIGFSYCDYDRHIDLGASEAIIEHVLEYALSTEVPRNTFYSVNIPIGVVKGLKKCRIANGHWNEASVSFEDPYGQKYYWLEGTYINDEENATDTDMYWLSKGYATLSPVTLDTTDYKNLDKNYFKDFDI